MNPRRRSSLTLAHADLSGSEHTDLIVRTASPSLIQAVLTALESLPGVSAVGILGHGKSGTIMRVMPAPSRSILDALFQKHATEFEIINEIP
jgi:hypothetical protein